MEQLNTLDVVILLGFAISMLVAFVRGFVKEVLSITGLILFVLCVIYLSPSFTEWLKIFIKSELMSKFVAFLVIMAVFYAFWILGTDKLISKIRTSTLSFMDRMFGLIFGFLRALIILGFCFLLVKIVLPEELKEKPLSESKFFVISKTSSEIIEAFIPEKVVKDVFKSVEDMNKVKDNKEEKENTNNEKIRKEEKVNEQIKELPSVSDQEQMNKMFDLLVKPEIKKISEGSKKNDDKKGYDKKDTSDLDELISETIE